MYPILFELGPVTIFSKWLFIAFGFVAASLLFVHLSKRNRIQLNVLTDHSFAIFFWTLAVSRIAFVIMNWNLFFYQFQFRNIFKLLEIWDKGFSFWGAIAAWFISIWYFSRKADESPLRLLDVMTPSILLGMVLGNLGAFLDGINYGSTTNLPWGMVFHSANVKYIAPIHPTQLYAALYTLVLTWITVQILKRNRGRLQGFIFEIGIFGFSTLKFFEEFFRGDETFEILSVRAPQILALTAAIASAYAIYVRYTNRKGGDPDLVLQKFVKKITKKPTKSNPPEIAEKMTPLRNQAM